MGGLLEKFDAKIQAARQVIRETDFASLLPLKASSSAALRLLQGGDRKTR